MVEAYVYSHVLKSERTIEHRTDSEMPSVKLTELDLKVGKVIGEDSIHIWPEWERLGMKPFMVVLSIDEAKKFREELDRALLGGV